MTHFAEGGASANNSRVLLHDSSGVPDPRNEDTEYPYRRRWDVGLIEIDITNGAPVCKPVELSGMPAAFRESVYKIGSPLGMPLKVSPGGNVLRYSFEKGGEGPTEALSRAITPCGGFTTTLDQFPGAWILLTKRTS
jgi:hypothetical protein